MMVMQAPQQQPSSDSSSDSNSASSAASDSSDSLFKSGASIALYDLPKVRLQHIVQSTCPELSAVATADWEVTDLVRVIWILCRVKPFTKVSMFGEKTYKKLSGSFQRRGQSMAGKYGAGAIKQVVEELIVLDPNHLKARAEQTGFDNAWLANIKKPKTRKSQQAGMQLWRMQQLTQIEGTSSHVCPPEHGWGTPHLITP